MRHLAALSTTIVMTLGSTAAAQGPSASDLKAAFLFNFAKFAEWPSLAPDAPVTVCIFGDDDVAKSLAENVRGQSVETHLVAVVRLPGDVPTRSCHVLFVTGPDARRAAALIEEAAPSPVLTVSDTTRFAETGGMVELFFESGQMRFAVNVDTVRRSRVRLSSRLLGLARIVRNPHAK